MAIIAPFWAPTDTYLAFRDGHSKVYYQVYSQTKERTSEILEMASKDVKLYGDGKKFANFAASWVLVVTWYKLCPYGYDNNCRWVRRLLSHNYYYHYAIIMEKMFRYIVNRYIEPFARADCGIN